ncbi:hypothetical protein EJ05DRAFT_459017, partial [Pseudovirgaria hyperparasitica]
MADTLRLNENITKETLMASTRCHNRLPPDTAFPEINVLSDGVKQLCAIISTYSAQSQFRLRLLHRHTTIPVGKILLGTRISEPRGYWTRPTCISDIDLHKIHAHIILVDATSRTSEGERSSPLLFPSEFREGPPVSAGTIDRNFFLEFTNCLKITGLENVLGLEAIQGQAAKMVEFSFDSGSLLLEEAEVREEVIGQFKSQVTGWAVTEDGAVDQTGETRCVIISGSHYNITNSKTKHMSDAIKFLRDKRVLA